MIYKLTKVSDWFKNGIKDTRRDLTVRQTYNLEVEKENTIKKGEKYVKN